MSPAYPVLDDRPIDQWKVTELKEELKRRKLMTKGLKEDLVKRLSKALLSEFDSNGDAGNLSKSDLKIEEDQRKPEIINDDVVASRKENEGDFGSVVDGNDAKGNVVDSVSTEDKKQSEIFIQEPEVVKEELAVVVSVSHLDLNHVNSHEANTNVKPELESEILLGTQCKVDKLKSPHADDGDSMSALPNSLTVSSGPDNQVPELSLAVGIQVKSDFSSTESGPIIEKSDVKDNIIADVRLQVDVKPQMVQLSSNTGALDSMDSDPVDVDVVHEKMPFLEEIDGDIAKTVDFIKNEDSGDTGSPGKLNLDRSSGDDSMEEDALVSKQNSGSDFLGLKVEEETISVAAVDMSLDTKVSEVENEKSSATETSKRKLHVPVDQSAVEKNNVVKRQRKAQPVARKLAREQSVNTVASTKGNDAINPTARGSFSKLESADTEPPKERVVPPSAKPPTNSLRIDRFLRPFTLKAVQDLLGRTGTVLSFWMDNIKTHCFVTFSSVEEAIETRNAVYNLQWPTNGGRLLIADFVNPQEVKARVEGPLQSPMTPTTPAGLRLSFPSAQPARPPQPSPKLQVQQQLPPPPPLLTNPMAPRDKFMPIKKQLAPVKEQLPPPPPPVPEKVDPPALTLDDLFQKTRASPRIYYQPLSDEQVAAKLNVQGIAGNNIKQ